MHLKMIEEGEKPLQSKLTQQCKKCEKRFKSVWNLKQDITHMKNQCSFCEKRLKYSSQHDSNMFVYSGENLTSVALAQPLAGIF